MDTSLLKNIQEKQLLAAQEQIVNSLAQRVSEKLAEMKVVVAESVGKEVDHHAAVELVNHANNNSGLYKTSHVPVAKNLDKKFKKGTYDHEKAKKLWKYHADRAADSYSKEYGDAKKGHTMFSPATRKKAAEHFADAHHAEMKSGNFQA
jgi:thymidine phosphorylase